MRGPQRAKDLSHEWDDGWIGGQWDVRREITPFPLPVDPLMDSTMAAGVAYFQQIWSELEEQARLAEEIDLR